MVGGTNAGNIPLKYSLDETLTGEKWIDGKPIYRKVLYYNSLPNSGTADYDFGIRNEDTVVDIHGVVYIPDDVVTFLPYVATSQQFTISLNYNKGTHKCRIFTGSDRRNCSGYLYIEYTKL